MNTTLRKAIVSAAVVLLTVTAARAQSAYSNAVITLNPVAYWPLQETASPPAADVETNLGSLGAIANAYYASTNAVRGVAGAIAGDTDPAVNFNGAAGAAFAIVPTTDHRVSLQPGQPFTVECWTRANGSQSTRGIITQTGPNNNGGLNGVNNSSGWSLNIGFGVYRGTGSQNVPTAWSFHVFNGYGFTGGAEAEAANNTGWLTGGTLGYTNSWVYLAGVFDGTNCLLYVYSTNLDNVTWGGTNLMNATGQTVPLAQLPITTAPGAPVGGPAGSNIVGAAFSPDTWDPIMLAATRGLGGNEFVGYLDEVAIYTNALTSDRIAGHFIAGTNGLGNYSATVMADSPYMYWRMDAPKYSWPLASSFPTATNFGNAGASMTNFNTLGTSAVYQPGTVPGVAGPSYPGFGNMTNACAFNGICGAAVDAGYNVVLDPTNVANFTLVAWFKANPWDYSSRWLCLASHSDQSWKAQFKTGVIYGYKGAGSQAQIAPATFNVNDDKWHMYVLQSIYTNGVCTNVSISLDGGIVSATITNVSAIPGKPTMDAFIGGAPEYGYSTPTNGTYNANRQYFPGRIAHVAYFTNALSLAQIQNLFFMAAPMPVIFTQPVSATVNQGTAFTNTVLALPATYPLSYQWYKDGAPLATQTKASLILNQVLTTDQSTNYYVVVTNTYGSATSVVVSLTVRGVPLLTGQLPISYTNPITLYGGSSPATLGSSPTFSVSIYGAQPVYRWRTNGVAMAGVTNATLTFTNCQMTSPTNFQCVVTNSFGAVTAAWTVAYAPAPTAPHPQLVLADRPVCYWRLNEPDDQLSDGNTGVICKDYQSANNGLYTNVVLGNIQAGTGYSPTTDPTETLAQFGFPQPGVASGIGSNIDFSAPSGSNVAFSVAVWANGNSQGQNGNAGLVTKGAWGAEQFTLDEGAPSSALRFTVRNAPGTSFYSANSSVQLVQDSNWHFVVGVCDEAKGTVSLYIDSQLAGSITIPVGSGILSSAEPVTIGARKNSGGGPIQFWGFLNDVSIYNYALSSNQIAQLYLITDVKPFMMLQPPANTNASYGGTLVVAAAASGTPPLFYQWYDVNASAYIAGQTNATLVVNNIQNSDTYYVTITNAYGSVDSTSVSVYVVAGAPVIYTDVKNPFSAFTGQSAVNSVLAYGTVPLSYQWQFYNGSTWVNLSDNGRISGSLSNILTIGNVSATDAGNYQVVVSNGSGSTTSGTATLTVFVLPVSFYGDGSLWTANGSARISNNLLSLTDPNNGGGDGSFFFQYPQYIGAFQAAFTYQAGGNKAADGVSFCLQNDPRGTTAMGTGGGQLAVGSTAGTQISPSAELEMNLFGTMGYAFGTNGIVPGAIPGGGAYVAPGTVQFNSGNPINVTLTYASGQAALSFADAVAGTSYSTSLNVGESHQGLGS